MTLTLDDREIATCIMQPAECWLSTPRGARGVASAVVVRNGHVIHASVFQLRGTERGVSAHLVGATLEVERVHRPLRGMTLSLRTSRVAGDPPEVLFGNRSPVLLEGTGPHRSLEGRLRRRVGSDWLPVVASSSCQLVFTPPLAPGETVAAYLPELYSERDRIFADSRYRITVDVRLADARDWDRHARALGVRRVTLPAGRHATAAGDLIHLAVRADGRELLGAGDPRD